MLRLLQKKRKTIVPSIKKGRHASKRETDRWNTIHLFLFSFQIKIMQQKTHTIVIWILEHQSAAVGNARRAHETPSFFVHRTEDT